MFKEISEKFARVRRASAHMWGNDSFSLHHLYIFLTSSNGQKRILNFIWKANKYVFRKVLGIKPDTSPSYDRWIRKNVPDEPQLQKFRNECELLSYRPLFSIIAFTAESSEADLNRLSQSLTEQVYGHWELLLVVDRNGNHAVEEFVNSLQQNEKRIRVVPASVSEENGSVGVSIADAVHGEFLTIADAKGYYAKHALYRFATDLNTHPETALVYSDDDETDENGNLVHPYFKSDWCPDSFLSRNYIGNSAMIRKTVLLDAGCPDVLPGPAALYDTLLRVTERTRSIRHIPDVLYHCGTRNQHAPGDEIASTIQRALERRNIAGKVLITDPEVPLTVLRYRVFAPGKVSVIIPSKNKADLCRVAVESIFKLTDYPNFEVILIDNNSDEADFFEFVTHWESREPERFRYLKDEGAFNYSRLMNKGAGFSRGNYFLLLNNDTEITQADWMTAMVEQCQFKTTGVTGVKLLYKNDTVQHAGVIIGLGGIAGHTFVGLDKDARGYHDYLRCITNYSALTAACLMVRRDAYYEVGGFDEELAVEYNDIDFCLKLREKGYNNIYLPHVTVYHYESVSRGHPHKTKKSYRQHLKDVALFRTRWQNYIENDPCYNPHLTRVFTDFRLRIDD